MVHLLVCDDTPRIYIGDKRHWRCAAVHEGRHYKKLLPYVPRHRALVEELSAALLDVLRPAAGLSGATDSSRKLLRLEEEIEALFCGITGYEALDGASRRPRPRKAGLMVLTHPRSPCTTIRPNWETRARVRETGCDFGPHTVERTKAWDTFMTLAETADKTRA